MASKGISVGQNGHQHSMQLSTSRYFASAAARYRSATVPLLVPTMPAKPGKAMVGKKEGVPLQKGGVYLPAEKKLF